MIWVDFAILIVIGISVAISIFRGFTKEALSLAGWVLAVWVAITFVDGLDALLAEQIEVPSLRHVVAFAILFLLTLFVAGLINYLAVQIIKKTGLSGTDRMIGVIFGVLRGVLVVVLLVLMGGFFMLPQDPWWKDSHLLHYFEGMAIWLRQFLPLEIAEQIRF